MEHEGAQSLTIPIYEPLDFRAEERNISLTAPQVVPETSSSLPRHALLQNFLPEELSQTDVNQTGGIGSEEGKESLPSDSLEPDYEFKKRKRKSHDPYSFEYDMLRKNKRAIKEDESLPTIDPSFPLSLLLQQEEFIFGDEEIENEEKAARDGKPSREETNEELNLTKWDLYERRVFKLSKLLARKSKTLQRKTGAEAELFRYQIYVIKWTILQIFEEVKQESIQDTRFPQLLNASNNETESNLEGGGGAGGLVDVDRIVCSKCGGVDTPGNDILLCDKVNCCRAYHQNCLEPRVDVSLIKDEPYWFCWVCDTVNNCLSWLNKKLGTEFDRPEAVFPEVSSESNNEELMRTWASKFPPGSYDPERPTPSTAQGAPADGSNPSSTKRKYKKKPVDESEDEEGLASLKRSKYSGKRTATDPNRPKLADSAYVVFSKANLPRIREENPGLNHPEIMSKLGQIWAYMSSEDKQEYIRQGEENKKIYRQQMLEYHRTRKEAPQHQPQLPHDDTKYILHTCIVCGKGFKTDGGYKYHIANVCVLEPPPSATPVQANPPSALPDIVHQTTLSASALSPNTAHAGNAPFRPPNIPLVGTHGGEVGRMIGANTAEEDEDVAAVFNDI